MSPLEVKNSNSVGSLNEKLSEWDLTHCDCNLCQPYTGDLEYVNRILCYDYLFVGMSATKWATR